MSSPDRSENPKPFAWIVTDSRNSFKKIKNVNRNDILIWKKKSSL